MRYRKAVKSLASDRLIKQYLSSNRISPVQFPAKAAHFYKFSGPPTGPSTAAMMPAGSCTPRVKTAR